VRDAADLPADAEARDVDEGVVDVFARVAGQAQDAEVDRFPRAVADTADRLVERAREAERLSEIAARAERDDGEIGPLQRLARGVDIGLRDPVQRAVAADDRDDVAPV